MCNVTPNETDLLGARLGWGLVSNPLTLQGVAKTAAQVLLSVKGTACGVAEPDPHGCAGAAPAHSLAVCLKIKVLSKLIACSWEVDRH